MEKIKFKTIIHNGLVCHVPSDKEQVKKLRDANRADYEKRKARNKNNRAIRYL